MSHELTHIKNYNTSYKKTLDNLLVSFLYVVHLYHFKSV